MVVTAEMTAQDLESAAQLNELLAEDAPFPNANCWTCRRLARRGGMVCAAFPDGIPWEIQAGEWDHANPHPRDRGIRYEPLQPDDFRTRADEYRAAARALREQERLVTVAVTS